MLQEHFSTKLTPEYILLPCKLLRSRQGHSRSNVPEFGAASALSTLMLREAKGSSGFSSKAQGKQIGS
jgi:hypothetical protein